MEFGRRYYLVRIQFEARILAFLFGVYFFTSLRLSVVALLRSICRNNYYYDFVLVVFLFSFIMLWLLNLFLCYFLCLYSVHSFPSRIYGFEVRAFRLFLIVIIIMIMRLCTFFYRRFFFYFFKTKKLALFSIIFFMVF